MLTREQAVEIQVLARQGQSARQIARELGISKNTVKRYLREPERSGYPERTPRPTKLSPYHEYLLKRVEEAKPDWIPASVLFRELRELGYEGGSSQLRAYLSPLKTRPKDDPVVRFETEPGEQMQADFTVIRRRDPLLAFVATLGYSRASFVRFTSKEDAQTLRRCLEASFEFFGGVPKSVLFDNPKTVIIERDTYGLGRHRFHPTLLDCAERMGFQIRVCRPYRARTKGKVERFNGYLKRSFVVPLSATLRGVGLQLDVTTANAHIGPWLQTVANARTHGTTDEVPADRLLIERPHLLPLPRVSDLPIVLERDRSSPMPIESMQHPLSIYDALLQEVA